VTVSAFLRLGAGQHQRKARARPTHRTSARSRARASALSLGKEGDFVFRGNASWITDGEQPQADTAHRVPRVWVQAVKWF
jgi:hypothetical protein